jgi:signal transduction histidine kinase
MTIECRPGLAWTLWHHTRTVRTIKGLPSVWGALSFTTLAAPLVSFGVWAANALRIRRSTRQCELCREERMRVARELHDTLLQGMLSASMQLHTAVDQMRADEPARALFTRVLQLMGQIADEGRKTIQELRIPRKDGQELEQALSAIPRELGCTSEVDFSVIVEGTPRALRPVIRDEIYWIGREALLNAFRHSGARKVELQMRYSAHQLRVVVRDDGCGIDPQLAQLGRECHWGLPGMRERAAKIASEFKIRSRASGGTEVELCVPGHVVFGSHRPMGRLMGK